jgi:FkbM family methyltransferase
LKKNIEANNLSDKILAYNMALSSFNGSISLIKSAHNYGDHRVSLDPVIKETANMQVEARMLDDVLADSGIKSEDVGLLWMDVQGHEKYVLEGAKQFITSGRPVLAEFAPKLMKEANVPVESLIGFIEENFSSYYDLEEAEPAQTSVSELHAIVDKYQVTYTDLLLVK